MDKIKVILVPDKYQVQIIFDTIYMYNDMCNYISRIVHERNYKKPRDLYYWTVNNHHKNFYEAIRYEFPDMNTCLIPLAFRKVAKAYKKRPSEAHEFSDTLDCSNGTVTIKHVMPSPENIGFLSLSTLGGRQSMHFIFEDDQRKELSVAFNRKRFREYELVIESEQMCLITDVYDQKNDDRAVERPPITQAAINKLLREQCFECCDPKYKHKLNASL